ncbi:cGMP-specific 3',5'-cyclic phosphodiesterase-like [Amphiura filiformis]|uniref:cGMP-specific 3',5'-cyclic phosphodiesterase-like n=1 Tax=Amphiura filiformis TaxID=82378 RepID=UPI003B21B18D
MAKQAVSLEVLSYHASAQVEEVDRIRRYTIPTCDDFKLYDFKFSDFDLSEDQTIQASLRMFLDCNLVTEYHIPYEVLCRWLLSVRKNYRPVIYHNWRHAFNVAQTMFAMFKSGKMEKFLSKLELFVLLVACLCHDLDHRGTNNAFQQKTESALSQLYSTSTMEHHHFDHSIMILQTEGNNIFQFLSAEDYRVALTMLETAILSTDLALYFKYPDSSF